MMAGLLFVGMVGLMMVLFMTLGSAYIFIYSCVMMLWALCLSYSEEFSLPGYGGLTDSIGVGLMILSVWVTLLMLFSSYKIIRSGESANYFMGMVYFLMVTLMITFFIEDYLTFYFFFEVSLIPTLVIIMGWGYQPERLQAGVYFIFYTLTASLPLLVAVNYFLVKTGSLSFTGHGFSFMNDLSGSHLVLVLIMVVLAFLVKLPMYLVHLWLPKAHVEAPVAGSMILAGVLLKLGGYGLMRVFIIVGPQMFKLNSYFTGLSLMGMVYVGVVCCRLNDFKALVAYSSVAHMGMVICGAMNVLYWGFSGCLMMMIAHGVASSGLFCIVNMYYERLGSRSFFINKGLLMVFPGFSLLMFLLVAANIAAPPSINLMSEIFLMASILSFDNLMMAVFPLGSFLGAVFSIYMFSYSQHGRGYYMSYGYVGSDYREFHTLSLHILPINLLVLNPSLFVSI